MSTGIENWQGTMTEVGALYPFVGTEFVWFVVCVALWIAWHIVQTSRENRQYEDEVKRFGGADSLKRLVGKEDPENP